MVFLLLTDGPRDLAHDKLHLGRGVHLGRLEESAGQNTQEHPQPHPPVTHELLGTIFPVVDLQCSDLMG